MTARWTVGEIAACLGEPQGGGRPGTPVSGVSTDTRTLPGGSLFVPLVGENFDGHDFAEVAVAERGAGALVWSREEKPAWLSDHPGVALFCVDDTLAAYQRLGLHWKRKCGVRCVAVTGSVGKTTTKEFIAHLLAAHLSVHKSRANYNNDIGVPKTLLELTPAHDVVVVEMGMRGPGEIARLVRAAEPEIGVVTAIGTSHIELLGSREGIARAKGELVEGLPARGRAVLPRNDDFFALLSQLSTAPVVSYSAQPVPDDPLVLAPEAILGQDAESSTFRWRDRSYRLELPGLHHLHDLFAALSVGKSLGFEVEDLLLSLPTLTHPEGRAEWRSIGGARFFLDHYNSAPESLRASLAVLQACRGRRLAVLGDMLELGPTGPEQHREIGAALAGYGVDLLLAYGPLSRSMVEGARECGVEAQWFEEKAALVRHLERELGPDVSVLVKASRGMALETVVEAIKERVG